MLCRNYTSVNSRVYKKKTLGRVSVFSQSCEMRLLTNNQGALSQKLILCNIFMFLIIVEFFIRHWRAHRWNLVCRHNNLTYCSYFSIQYDTSNQVTNSIVLIMLITMMVMITDGEKTWINSCRQKTKSVFFLLWKKQPFLKLLDVDAIKMW